jgi:Predicted transcriptional regulators
MSFDPNTLKDTENFPTWWPIDRLIPYEKNAKKHDKKQVSDLAGIIKEFGWKQALIVSEKGDLISGHGRRLAALELGCTEVPVVVAKDWTDEKIKALRLADNRVTGTDYDISALQEELAELANADFDISGLGFDERELEFMTELDLGAIDENAFIDDVDGLVDQQQKDMADSVDEVKKRKVKLADAIGIVEIDGEDERSIAQFMSVIQARYPDLSAPKAFVPSLKRSWREANAQDATVEKMAEGRVCAQ